MPFAGSDDPAPGTDSSAFLAGGTGSAVVSHRRGRTGAGRLVRSARGRPASDRGTARRGAGSAVAGPLAPARVAPAARQVAVRRNVPGGDAGNGVVGLSPRHP